MANSVKKKKVAYIVGASLDGPVYCEHDVVEDAGAENQKYPKQAKVELQHGQKSAPRPNLRQMPSSHKETQGTENNSSRSGRRR